MCDLICYFINFYVWSCDMGKMNVYDKMMIENQKKKRNLESPADARRSADIIDAYLNFVGQT